MGGGEPRPYTLAAPQVRHPSISGTLFAHARGIYLKRKSELPLPAHARCTCARHAARTLTRHSSSLPLVLPCYSRLVQIIAWIGPRNFRRFVRLSSSEWGSYEKMLVERDERVNLNDYRSNLFVPGNDGRLRLFANTRYLSRRSVRPSSIPNVSEKS